MKWIKREAKIDNIKLNLPDIIKKILANRGYDTDEKIKKFLSLNNFKFHDPFLLPNINKAIKRVEKALENKEKITIYGDYDVDGVTASSILYDFLKNKLKADVDIYIPSRFTEGYGLNKDALEKITKVSKLVITVDCGVRDRELINEFKSKLDFIVTDHHMLPTNQDFDYPVIHPLLKSSKYPFAYISGGAVAWKFVIAMAKYFNIELDSNEYLELVALSTVCDIMPLVDENRDIVKAGLLAIKEKRNLGLVELFNRANVSPDDVKSYHLGFLIGPRINAAGRMQDARLACDLFISDNKKDTFNLSLKLDRLNQERQKLLQETLEIAKEQAKEDDNIIIVSGESWHEGIVGLVAGRLNEEFNKPTICASIDSDSGIVMGSARSIPGFHITEAISKFSSLLLKFGGHSQAAGFSCKLENFEDFKNALINYAKTILKPKDFEKETIVDATIKLNDINLNLLKWIDLFEPFGLENPNIVFEIQNVKIVGKYEFGQNKEHLKLIGRQELSKNLEITAFFASKQFKKIEIGDTIDAIGILRKNLWRDKLTIQFNLLDFKFSNEKNK